MPEKINDVNIQALYGNKMQTSVSKLEQYRKCPFSFHLKYGLGLDENGKFELKSLDTGSFMHDVIEDFFEKVKNKEIQLKELAEEANVTERRVYQLAKKLGRLPTVEEIESRKGKRGRPKKYESEENND